MQPNINNFYSGPFRAEHIKDGDYYEISNGHAIQCMPGGRDHADHNLTGAKVISTDPDVEWAGVDAGYSPEPGMLRAPDVAVGTKGTETGWIKGVPALALEYAGSGQDEDELIKKIQEFFTHGTKYIWVVRLVGMRRVEVYEPGKPMRRALSGENLTAPGVLRNPVPVDALYDREAAHEVTLRNLLQRKGYTSLDAVRIEGKTEGKAEGKAEGKYEGEVVILKKLIIHRFGNLPAWAKMRIDTADVEQVETWAEKIFEVTSVEELFAS